MIKNKDKNLKIFKEESKGNLFCEIETSKLSLKNVLIVECGDKKCDYNINIENIKSEKKEEKDKNNTKTILIIIGIIVVVLIVVIILLLRYFKKSSNDNKMIEKINDLGELKK